ncbi:alpha/beta fold hydrolase [Streptomyces sp. CG4]|uniref:alpha/beta fold hydrolase n=1 Tax=Streptomyces sp. CG4 TaxID=408783 RepID=UPI0034E2B65E
MIDTLLFSRRRRMMAALLVLAAAAGCALAPGSGNAATPTASSSVGSSPAWSACPLPGQPTRQCATVRVPVDAAKPNGEKVGIAISRLPAAKRSERIGALVWNPGGPGESGLWAPAALLPPELSERFDLIGFDMRGTGKSGALPECGETTDELKRLSETPGLAKVQHRARLAAAARSYTERCTRKLGPIAGHLGSRDVARDIDAIRAALGEEKISLLMGSYGTMLAQAYLTLHPDRVRAAVLDGTMDPAVSGVRASLDGSGSQTDTNYFSNDPDDAAREKLRLTLSGFTPWCRAHEDVCPVHADPLGSAEKAAGLRGGAPQDKAARTKRVLGAAVAAMFVPDRWQALAGALGAARTGSTTALDEFAAQGVPKELADVMKPTLDLGYDLGVRCTDFAWPRTVDGVIDTYVKQGGGEAGYIAADYLPCAFWPRPEKPLGALKGSAGVTPLVINGEHDPRTGIEGARAAARRLGARLLTFPGRTHEATTGGVECAQRAAVVYLTNGKTADLPECGIRR